jgi:hypothetical protein
MEGTLQDSTHRSACDLPQGEYREIMMRHDVFTLMVVTLAVLSASCSHVTDSDEDYPLPDDLFGTWVRAEYEEGIMTLRESEELEQDEYGFRIHPDGRFLERKNAGWCGTPPISYENYDGEWKGLSESLLEITVGYWGGTTSYRMEIVSLGSADLHVRFHYD